jgi:hypothetical protein
MAIKTNWQVQHRCGHRIDWDLADKPAAERAAFATWLAQRDCTRCWWAKRRNPHRSDRAATRIERRAQETADMKAWETRTGMPTLEGSKKSVTWGRALRYRLLRAAQQHHVVDGRMSAEDFTARFEAPARRVASATWWIDQRETDPSFTEQLLADAATNEPTRTAKTARSVIARPHSDRGGDIRITAAELANRIGQPR